MTLKKLETYIQENQLSTAEILPAKSDTLTVEQSAKAFGIEPEDIVKSLVVKTSQDEFYLVIVQGHKLMDFKKLKRVLNVKKVQLASPQEVEVASGYAVGDVPPISVDLNCIVDKGVLSKNMVYGGGGSSNTNLKISVEELLACNDPRVAEITKEK